jgi:hypothetical protein
MTIAPCNANHASIQPSAQDVQSAAPLRADPIATAQVTRRSDDVFSSARRSRPLYLQGVSDGLSRRKNDSAPIQAWMDDKTDATKQREALDGQINTMDVYPAERDKIMRDLDNAIATTRAALDQVDRHWNAKTLSDMTALLGDGAKSDDVRAAIKSRLENALSVLEKNRTSKGKDIFMQDPGVPNSLAYVRKSQSGYTGHMVFSKTALGVVDDARIQKTLIHETLHIASHLSDHWYVRTDESGNLYRKAPSSSAKGTLPPLTSDKALDNADSVAYAAVVLAKNGTAYHDER